MKRRVPLTHANPPWPIFYRALASIGGESAAMTTCTSHHSNHHYLHHHFQWCSAAIGETKGSMPLELVLSFLRRFMRKTTQEEWRWFLRKDSAQQCSYVMCGVILRFSPSPLTYPLHLKMHGSRGDTWKRSGWVWTVWGWPLGKRKIKWVGGWGLRTERKEEVILWATAFQTTGLSGEISVKRARELFSCFPLFRDISCGILLFSVTELSLSSGFHVRRTWKWFLMD